MFGGELRGPRGWQEGSVGDKTSEVGRARPPRTSTETLNERTSPAYRRTLWDHVGTDESGEDRPRKRKILRGGGRAGRSCGHRSGDRQRKGKDIRHESGKMELVYDLLEMWA